MRKSGFKFYVYSHVFKYLTAIFLILRTCIDGILTLKRHKYKNNFYYIFNLYLLFWLFIEYFSTISNCFSIYLQVFTKEMFNTKS